MVTKFSLETDVNDPWVGLGGHDLIDQRSRSSDKKRDCVSFYTPTGNVAEFSVTQLKFPIISQICECHLCPFPSEPVKFKSFMEKNPAFTDFHLSFQE